MTDHQRHPSRRDILVAAATLSLAAGSSVATAQVPLKPPVPASGEKKKLGMVLFDGFELLDVFGPLEMFGMLKDRVEIVMIDGVRATSNKMAWKWATAQGANVLWVPKARWVEDGKYISSSGISAGTDMALGLIARLYGRDMAQWVAHRTEYRWNENAADDPFAAMNGLNG